MTQSEKVKVVAKILKKRYPDTTHEEAVFTAWLVVEALDAPPTKVTSDGA